MPPSTHGVDLLCAWVIEVARLTATVVGAAVRRGQRDVGPGVVGQGRRSQRDPADAERLADRRAVGCAVVGAARGGQGEGRCGFGDHDHPGGVGRREGQAVMLLLCEQSFALVDVVDV